MPRPLPLCLLALAACSSPEIRPTTFAAPFAAEQREALDDAEEARLREMEQRLRAGAYDEVIPELEETVRDHPGLAEAWLLLGQARLDRAYAPLREDTPRRRTVNTQELTRAESALLAAQRLAPDLLAVDRALAVLFEREGHLEAAHEAAARVLRARSFDVESLLTAARCAAELGWERQCVHHLEALRALRPHPIEAIALETGVYRRLALGSDDVELRTTWSERLQRAWREWSARNPKDARGPRGAAAALRLRVDRFGGAYDDERIRRIDELLESARRLAPTDPEVAFEAGLFAERTKRPELAERHYRRALDLERQHLDSLVNLGSLLWASERQAEARIFWERALPLLENDREREQIEALLRSP